MNEIISSDKFSFSAKNNELYTEASDLRWSVGVVPREFQVKSEKTGKVRTFYKTFTAKDDDNDVLYGTPAERTPGSTRSSSTTDR